MVAFFFYHFFFLSRVPRIITQVDTCHHSKIRVQVLTAAALIAKLVNRMLLYLLHTVARYPQTRYIIHVNLSKSKARRLWPTIARFLRLLLIFVSKMKPAQQT